MKTTSSLALLVSLLYIGLSACGQNSNSGKSDLSGNPADGKIKGLTMHIEDLQHQEIKDISELDLKTFHNDMYFRLYYSECPKTATSLKDKTCHEESLPIRKEYFGQDSLVLNQDRYLKDLSDFDVFVIAQILPLENLKKYPQINVDVVKWKYNAERVDRFEQNSVAREAALSSFSESQDQMWSKYTRKIIAAFLTEKQFILSVDGHITPPENIPKFESDLIVTLYEEYTKPK